MRGDHRANVVTSYGLCTGIGVKQTLLLLLTMVTHLGSTSCRPEVGTSDILFPLSTMARRSLSVIVQPVSRLTRWFAALSHRGNGKSTKRAMP
jgi:hypothetical protein